MPDLMNMRGGKTLPDHRHGSKLLRSPRRQLVIMVKEPVMGRVKTRLSQQLGFVRATMFYRQTLAQVIGRLAFDRRWHTSLSVAPTSAVHSTMLPLGPARLAQDRGDIGQRMQSIFDCGAAGPVVVIGTDIPGVQPCDIANAFGALGRHDLVFGPAEDGGFWLVGMRRTPRILKAFDKIRWSSEHTLHDTLVGLDDGVSVAFVRRHSDADEARDLVHLAPILGRRVLSGAADALSRYHIATSTAARSE